MTAINTYAFADEASPALAGQIAALLRNGMQGIEIRNVDGENVSDISLQKAKSVREQLDANQLVTWSVGSPIGKIDIREGDFRAHLDKLEHTLEIARVLGAERLRMFSFYIPSGDDPAAYRDAVMERLERMAALARDAGVRLCHENEKGIYGDVAPRCADIHRSVPGIAGVFDPANFIQCGQDTAEAWRLLKPWVLYMHIKDATADGSVVPAGCGVGAVRDILRAFVASGGRAVTLEPHLSVFEGLAALEREGERSRVGQYVYGSGDEAFDAAAAALRALLENE